MIDLYVRSLKRDTRTEYGKIMFRVQYSVDGLIIIFTYQFSSTCSPLSSTRHCHGMSCVHECFTLLYDNHGEVL